MNKKLLTLLVTSSISISSVGGLYAADQVEQGTPTVSTTTATSATTGSGLTVTPQITSDGTKVMVKLPVTLDKDVSGGELHITYPADKLTYTSVEKGSLVQGTDVLDADKSVAGKVAVVFTSDVNKDMSGDVGTLTFTVNSGATGDIAIEIVALDGTVKSEILGSDGNTKSISGKATYTLGSVTTTASGSTSSGTEVTPVETTPEVVTPVESETEVVPVAVTTSVTESGSTDLSASGALTGSGSTNLKGTTNTKTGAGSQILLSLFAVLSLGAISLKRKAAKA